MPHKESAETGLLRGPLQALLVIRHVPQRARAAHEGPLGLVLHVLPLVAEKGKYRRNRREEIKKDIKKDIRKGRKDIVRRRRKKGDEMKKGKRRKEQRNTRINDEKNNGRK